MNSEKLEYEEKLDNISEHMQELILSVMLSVLREIKERNMLFDDLSKKIETDDISF